MTSTEIKLSKEYLIRNISSLQEQDLVLLRYHKNHIYIRDIGVRRILATGCISVCVFQGYVYKRNARKMQRHYLDNYVLDLAPCYNCGGFLNIEHLSNRKYKI